MKTTRLLFLGFAFLLSLVYDLFFWNNQLGLSLPLFIAVYLAGFLFITIKNNHFHNKHSLWLLIPISILSLDFVLYNNHFVHTFIPVILLFLVLLFSTLATIKNPNKNLFFLSRIPFVRNLFTIFDHFSDIFKDVFSQRPRSEKFAKIIVGILISIPILIVFATLFISADQIFAENARELFNFEVSPDNFWRILRTALLTLSISAFFYLLLSEKNVLLPEGIPPNKMDTTIVTVILTLVNLLFFSFVFIQFKYLFGNASYLDQSTISYANYARQGFFELVWVMIFTGILLMVIYRTFAAHKLPKAISALKVILVLQVSVVAFSALTRMNLYQEEFGFTTLRLYVEWFIYCCLFVFAFGVYTILSHFQFQKFLYFNGIFAITVLTLVSTINIDYLIANKNIDRYLNQDNDAEVLFDLNYIIYDLSLDAVPALPTLHNHLTESISQGETRISNDRFHTFQSDLDKIDVELRKIIQRDRDNTRNFLEYNYGYAKAVDIANQLQ